MIRRLIKYEYYSVTLGCGCCHEGTSYYTLWENGVETRTEETCPIMSDEQDLRGYFDHLEPFDIHSECEFF